MVPATVCPLPLPWLESYLAGKRSVCGKGHATGMQGSIDGLGQSMEGFTVSLACT